MFDQEDPPAPDNADFDDLPDAFRERVAARFERGIEITQRANEITATRASGPYVAAVRAVMRGATITTPGGSRLRARDGGEP